MTQKAIDSPAEDLLSSESISKRFLERVFLHATKENRPAASPSDIPMQPIGLSPFQDSAKDSALTVSSVRSSPLPLCSHPTVFPRDDSGLRVASNAGLPAPVLEAIARYEAEFGVSSIQHSKPGSMLHHLQRRLKSVPPTPSEGTVSENPNSHVASAGPMTRETRGLESDFSTRIHPSERGFLSPRPLDLAAIRADFPALQQEIYGHPLVWFDNAATTHKPVTVIESLSHFYRSDYSNIHRAAHSLAARATDLYESSRETVAEFIGADCTRDIVFVRGTTEGINFIANTYKALLNEGDEILLTEMEHHANIVPWQMIVQERRVRIRVIPFDHRGELLMDEYRRLLTPRVKLVCVTHASNTLGTVLPVEEMAAMAHRQGARILVDGAQSIAHLPIDVRAMGCDYFVFSGHKVFAPTGIGVVYIHPDLQERLPPWQGGGNMIHRVTFDETTYADPPAKFEAGTPSIGDAVGLGAALHYLKQFDSASLFQHEHDLLENTMRQLRSIRGVHLFGNADRKIGVVSFTLDGYSTEAVGKELDRYGIAVRTGHHCAQPSLRHFGLESTIRPSFALYNTHEEVDKLISVIHRLARKV